MDRPFAALVPYGASLYDTWFQSGSTNLGAGSLLDFSHGVAWLILAQNGGGGGAAGGDGGMGGFGLWPAVIASLVAMYLLMIRPERAREKELKARLENLKKNDRVLTAGGIYGVVMNVRREVDEVTLKIDEDTGAKLRCTLRSIARVLESPEEKS